MPSVERRRDRAQRLIVAAALVETIAGKVGRELTVRRHVPGREAGRPALSCRRSTITTRRWATSRARCELTARRRSEHLAWRVVPAEFVTVDSGTGVVHQAPAFGEVDYDVLLAEQIAIRRRAKGRD